MIKEDQEKRLVLKEPDRYMARSKKKKKTRVSETKPSDSTSEYVIRNKKKNSVSGK